MPEVRNPFDFEAEPSTSWNQAQHQGQGGVEPPHSKTLRAFGSTARSRFMYSKRPRRLAQQTNTSAGIVIGNLETPGPELKPSATNHALLYCRALKADS
jgi:hypothetical protein